MNRASDSGGVITKKPTFITGIPEEEELRRGLKNNNNKNKSFPKFYRHKPIDSRFRS